MTAEEREKFLKMSPEELVDMVDGLQKKCAANSAAAAAERNKVIETFLNGPTQTADGEDDGKNGSNGLDAPAFKRLFEKKF